MGCRQGWQPLGRCCLRAAGGAAARVLGSMCPSLPHCWLWPPCSLAGDTGYRGRSRLWRRPPVPLAQARLILYSPAWPLVNSAEAPGPPGAEELRFPSLVFPTVPAKACAEQSGSPEAGECLELVPACGQRGPWGGLSRHSSLCHTSAPALALGGSDDAVPGT